MKRPTPTPLLLAALLALASAAALARAPALQKGAPPRPRAEERKGERKGAPPRRYETVPFESRLVGARLPYNVILPADYGRGPARHRRYPVLYLLHGLGGGANDWVSSRTRLADHAARYPLIVVLPEGRDGWYTDSATAPNEKFESYFVEELIPDVERRFRAIPAREGRAVAGLSMGGYGALKFALKHPGLFAFAGSMSGALLNFSQMPDDVLPRALRPSVARVYGAPGSETRMANDIFGLVRGLTPERVKALPFLYLDCGTEDVYLGTNRDFSALLVEKKVPHEFRQLPGTHGWSYWDWQVREVLRLAARGRAAGGAE